MKPIRVVILDDSKICRSQLRAFLCADGDIDVVAEGASGDGILELLQSVQVDLLVVDLQMPGLGGHETIARVMAHAPLPILVVTGQPLGKDRHPVFESIRRGALDLAEKPSSSDRTAQEKLRNTVRRLASVPVVRHVAGKRHERSAARFEPSILPPREGSCLLVGIASSAGGPMALTTLLSSLDPDFGAAVVVVQHLPASFLPAFGEFLGGRVRLSVKMITEPVRLSAGTVYVPGSDAHITLKNSDTVALTHGPARNGHRPSADALFESMARFAGSRASGVVLSDIGTDGTEGLAALRRAGGLCLAQDQESCAVFGMPRSALESGAAEASLPPLGLAQAVTRWTLARKI